MFIYEEYKDVFYQIKLNDIEQIIVGEYYRVIVRDKVIFEFIDDKLYHLLIKNNQLLDGGKEC